MTALPVLDCTDCGVCCLHVSVPPYDVDEVEYLKEYVPLVHTAYQAVQRTRQLQLAASGEDYVPCGFLDMETRRCRYYENRPDVCQVFEVGGEFCLLQRTKAGMP